MRSSFELTFDILYNEADQEQDSHLLTEISSTDSMHRTNGSRKPMLAKRLFRLDILTWTLLTVAFVLFAISLPGRLATAQPRSDSEHRIACSRQPEDCRTTAPFIFDSVHSLLKQWPNTYASNGHTIAAATVPVNTPLYHARHDGAPVKTPTFYAFDAEMSLGIYGGSGTPQLYTMVTTRSLRVLYFDGQSATLTALGTLDSQMALLQGRIPTNPSEQLVYDEVPRAFELCRLAKDLKIDGIMRMNTGFELLVCDNSASGIVEVFQADVTVPGNEEREKNPALSRDPNRLPPLGFGNEFAPQNSWEWIRSGTRHYGSAGGEGRSTLKSKVQIDYCGIVTYYDPQLRSLSGRHRGTSGVNQNGWGLRRGHRLHGISKKGISAVKNWLHDITSAQTATKRRCSGINWQALTETITDQHRSRIREISASIKTARGSSDQFNASLHKIHELSHAILYPYIEYPTRVQMEPKLAKDNAITRCSTLYTRSILVDSMNDFEFLIKQSIEIVMRGLCAAEWALFEWSDRHTSNLFDPQNLLLDSKEHFFPQADSTRVFRQIQGVIRWLGWNAWDDCERKCETNEICYIPMWPVVYAPGKHQGGFYADDSYTMKETRELWRPKCLNRTQFDRGGGRARRPSERLPDVPEDQK